MEDLSWQLLSRFKLIAELKSEKEDFMEHSSPKERKSGFEEEEELFDGLGDLPIERVSKLSIVSKEA